MSSESRSKPCCHEFLPIRAGIAIMLFFSMFFSYILRGNLSMTIMSMTNASEMNLDNETESSLPNYGPRYNWPAVEQGLLLGSYFYGYTISNLPGGYLAEIIGGRRLLGVASIVSAILSFITPFLAPYYWISFTNRFFMGFFSGFLLSTMQSFIVKWAPPNEKTKFLTTLSGGSLGTTISWPIVGLIIEYLGWAYVYYITAILCIAFNCLWFYLVYDSPAQHPRISEDEREYIESRLVGLSESAKLVPPYFSILTSIPFWALLLSHYGNMWGIYFVLTGAPKFMNEVLGFKIGKSGFLSMLPSLCRLITVMIFAIIGDWVRSKNWFGPTWERKLFTIPSHIIPGLFLLGLNYVNTSPYWCVAFMTISMGFNGAAVVTCMQNAHDLAPNYTSTIYGIINAFGTTTGFVAPLVVAYFTRENNTLKEWEMVFIVGGLVYLLPGIFFMLCGTGKCQKWNEPKSKRGDNASDAATGTLVVSVEMNNKELEQTDKK